MSDTIKTKVKRVAKEKVAKVKVDKYSGFKVPIKTRVSTKWTIYIYDMIKEAKPELLESDAVKIAYNNLVECLIKYEGWQLETWIPPKYQKYNTGIKPKKDSYGYSQSLPVRWNYTWQQQNDPIIKAEIKEKTDDIINTYIILYDLIKRDVVPYMELKEHTRKSKKDIDYFHRVMEKLENDIKVWERAIESNRKSIGEYAAKCIALETPILTKFD